MLRAMIRQIAPQFFTTRRIRTNTLTSCSTPTSSSRMRMLHAEYTARGDEFARDLDDTPWNSREFVVKDCDGRLLAFGANAG